MSAAPPILILTGCPGSGKTAAARQFADDAARGLHLRVDDLFLWPAHPIDPTKPESQAQNETVVRAACRAAGAFHESGYDVIVDGIFGPWMLPLVRQESGRAGIEFAYAVLRVDLETAISRGTGRAETPVARRVVEQMHAALADLGALESHALDANGLQPAEVAAWLKEHRERLRLPRDSSD